MTVRRRGVAAIGIAASVLLAGCASGSEPVPGEGAETGLSGELTIFAAASLQAAFDDIAAAFEEEHPGVDVLPISYDGSSTLVTQIQEGAPADVFASADEANMDKLTEPGLVEAPELFATNTLVIAVPAGNPGDVVELGDLAGVTTVLCAPEVPCGAASGRLLEAQGVALQPASLEQNVTAVLAKVEAGEADAGLVYATDVAGNDDVESIVPDGADDIVNRYPVAALGEAQNPEAAAAFVAFVTSDEGQEILEGYGFGAP